MIIEAMIENQPYSGEYKERIYDIPSQWNTQDWTWIKFVNEDASEWYGNFRGFPRGIALSKKHGVVLILTSDYLFQLDSCNGELLDYDSQPDYKSLTLSPLGEFIVASDCDIYLLNYSLKEIISLPSPDDIDMIEFNGWHGNKLFISSVCYLDYNQPIRMELNGETLEISIRDTNN